MRKKSTDRSITSGFEGAAEFPRPSRFCGDPIAGAETVVLALGSNCGDREVHLRRAVRELARHVSIVAISSLWETDPVGCRDGAGSFLNLVLAGWTRLDPAALLAAVSAVERLGGRRRRYRNDPRTIDVDILFFGNRALRTHDLVVPHPRFRERNFVLEPLREIARTIAIPPFAGDLRLMKGEGNVRRAGGLY
jgi:2-amino-4-hydroxy-6-hydroxymethyldihydropteridine diphosphokinase